jgi:hypothetical protein
MKTGTGMAKDRKEAGMLQYRKEHVAYERTMLGYTYARLHDTAPGMGWNVVYESFGIHARNLYDFLRKEGKTQTTFRADDYVKNWPKPKALLSVNEFDVFLFHMSTARANRQKMNLERLQQIGTWLDIQWANWVRRLSSPYGHVLNHSPVCATPLVLQADITQATACTIFAMASTTSGGRGITRCIGNAK